MERRQTSGSSLTSIVHPPIISEDDFAQPRICSPDGAAGRQHKPHSAARLRAARGAVLRTVRPEDEGNWNNEQAYYRCRFPTEYALANQVDHPKTVYVREADVLGPSMSGSRNIRCGSDRGDRDQTRRAGRAAKTPPLRRGH